MPKTTNKTTTKGTEELPPFKELVEVGEIMPDSSGKTLIKVRVIERRSDGVRLVDIRKFIKNPDKTKYSGPTRDGVALSDIEQVQEMIDLLTDAKEEYEALGKSKKAVKKEEKKKAKK